MCERRSVEVVVGMVMWRGFTKVDLILEQSISRETLFLSISFGIQGFAYSILYTLCQREDDAKGVGAVFTRQ